MLILLNRPPASGKSTIAQRFVDDHPLALNLDVDVIECRPETRRVAVVPGVVDRTDANFLAVVVEAS